MPGYRCVLNFINQRRKRGHGWRSLRHFALEQVEESVMVRCYRPRVKITRSSWLTDNLNCCDFEDARVLLPSFRPGLDGLRLTFTLGGETLVERAELDHRSLVGSVADFLGLVARRHLELDPLAVDLGDL